MRESRSLIILTAILAWGASLSAAEAKRPNIVVILSDDMGYSDLGCYGGELATPHLDALAANGLRFAQFYNNARCCPTRASLLTGLYPHQAGIGHMTDDRGYDGYRGVLNRQSVTIPEVLRPAGYRTYMCGKWHVTRFLGEKADRSTWPLGRGFDKFYGTIAGGGSFYDPTTLCRQDILITPVNDTAYRPASFYYTDAISDNAVKFLAEHRKESPDKPFFLYVAYTAAHWPMHAPEAAIAKYKGRYDAGYAPVREARLRRMKELGLVQADTPLSPGSDDWSAVADRAWEARCMEVYAAMVEIMDAGIGRIVAQLKADGQLDDTLVLFLQDNGACAEDTGRKSNGDGPDDLKPMGPDDLQPRVLPPMQTRDGRWVRSGPGVMPGAADTYVAYGRGWANVSNTPFREYKHWAHEGGISTPLIAHWPAGIRPDRAGRLERQPGHLIDIMATCVDLAGATYPTEVDGKAIKPREGVSLRPVFNGEPLARVQPLFWEHEGNRAVRDSDWKLVARENKPWELYNIAADRTESHDLAASEPARVKAMAAAWDAYAARADVLPLGAWRPKEKESESIPLSRKRQFTLKPGDHLDRAEAPAIANRPFTITAVFEASDDHPDGVIVAQGGAAHGYTLFLKGGQPRFLIRTADGIHHTDGPRLTPGAHTVTARLDAKGTLSLDVDGRPSAPVPGVLITRMPADGLDVGSDKGSPVGPYSSPYRYPGAIESVAIATGGE
jgi:arylsulfatase